MNTVNLQNGDCLKLMKNLADNSVDLIFCDPPYALGSEIIIRQNGKPDYKKAIDFMNKWEMPDGNFWQEWYLEAFRVLKYGGHCAMFGIDRQTFLFQYYAVLNGFVPKQSLYWYFISNFPKASDLSKNIDKRFGLERGILKDQTENSSYRKNKDKHEIIARNKFTGDLNITAPSTPLAHKYNGLKYSVAPLKQTCEEIMVFQKPYKHGSCLNDVLAYEEGDGSITVGALDIEGNRVGVEKIESGRSNRNSDTMWQGLAITDSKEFSNGRYPAQTFIDSGIAEVLDKQSGISKGGNLKLNSEVNRTAIKSNALNDKKPNTTNNPATFGDSGGCSRILHKCDYEDKDFDLMVYCPKVSKSERNEGLEGFELKTDSGTKITSLAGDGITPVKPVSNFNSHPTLKPTKLLIHILKLFKTPNKQVILDPFMGSGSMGISAIETGYDYIGYELDPEYFQIAKSRIENAQNILNSKLI